MMQRKSYMDYLAGVRKVVTPTGAQQTKKIDMHKLHNTHYGYLCSAETPEGHLVGLVKHFALMCRITNTVKPGEIMEVLRKEDIISIEDMTPTILTKYTKVMLNGDWFGCTTKASELHRKLIDFRRRTILHPEISIVRDFKNNEIRIFSDAGRTIRPVYIVDSGNKLRINSEAVTKLISGEWGWIDLIRRGMVEYLDVQESEHNSFIANYPKDLAKDPLMFPYTHCEIHPVAMLGATASLIPFANHNQSPRNLFQCAQGKQAMCVYSTNFNERMDTMGHVVWYSQVPLVSTCTAKYTHYNDVPSGQNVIVAIMTYSGYNQEDSLVFNQSSLDRGMFRSWMFKMYKEETKGEDKFMKPDPIRTKKYKKRFNYEKLDDNGFVPPDTEVFQNDIILGKVKKLDKVDRTKEMMYQDDSMRLRTSNAIIDKNIIDENSDGYKFAKVRTRQIMTPQVGDKFACSDSETEVLTDSGWKYFYDLNKEDKIATLRDDQFIEYNNPIEIFKYKHVGKMYLIQSQQIDQCVTLNHKMYVKQRLSDTYELITADEIFGERVQYKKDGVNDFKDRTKFVLPACENFESINIDLDSWLTFFGIFIAEGWSREYKRKNDQIDYSVEISVNKQRVQNELNRVCQNLKWKYTVTSDNVKWRFNNKQLTKCLQKYSPGATKKYLPKWCFKLSQRQSRILLAGLLCGDGYTTNSKTEIYYTSSTQLANDVQVLAFHAGWSGNIKERYPAGTPYKIGNHSGVTTAQSFAVHIVKSKNTPTVNHSHVGKQKIQKEEIIDYDGYVYCCEVPNHIMYIRRNGKPVWSGNSRHGQLASNTRIAGTS